MQVSDFSLFILFIISSNVFSKFQNRKANLVNCFDFLPDISLFWVLYLQSSLNIELLTYKNTSFLSFEPMQLLLVWISTLKNNFCFDFKLMICVFTDFLRISLEFWTHNQRYILKFYFAMTQVLNSCIRVLTGWQTCRSNFLVLV